VERHKGSLTPPPHTQKKCLKSFFDDSRSRPNEQLRRSLTVAANPTCLLRQNLRLVSTGKPLGATLSEKTNQSKKMAKLQLISHRKTAYYDLLYVLYFI
jgi:hypothetical protein